VSFHCPDKFRIRKGNLATRPGDAYGAFFIPVTLNAPPLRVIATDGRDGSGWEHVSVSLPGRCPTWIEMCFVKSTFWDEEDCVVQYHPPRSVYVNTHPFCLHLWRPIDSVFPMPPPNLVGLTEAFTQEDHDAP
jgi:hypothetical protein